jgi:homoaconitase/3-isopropylmalate dehydratase large subunit
MLFILAKIGCDGATGKVMEFRGSVVEQLPSDERMTLANLAVECGAVCGIMPVDAPTRQYVQRRTPVEFEEISGDQNAIYERAYRFNLSSLESQVARPPRPDRGVGISQLEDIPVTRAFIGSCTGGKLFDLAQAAEVLKGRQIAPDINLFVVPATQEIQQKAQELGYLDILEQAGAQVLKSGCGACINAGVGVLREKEVGIYATNRNFQGRSGDPSAQNYLASPRVVAISAVRGKITAELD